MKLPWNKPRDNYVFVWEEQPYQFEKGMIYVIEVAMNQITGEDVAGLQRWFTEQGVIVRLVVSGTGKALNPIVATRKKENKR